ncbi:hypothetical protein TNCV_1537701 [Trichonephila clavipes]|nr:hypothetical protein TNCV_1537701 [Trichonephila clavipes]
MQSSTFGENASFRQSNQGEKSSKSLSKEQSSCLVDGCVIKNNELNSKTKILDQEKVCKKAQSSRGFVDLLQNLPSETSDELTDDFSDEVPANYLLEFSLDF